MKTVWVEELLEVYYPLQDLVHSYKCPPLDGNSSSGGQIPSSDPSADLTFVIDMGLALQTLSTSVQNVLYCVYGLEQGLRSTARKLKTHPQEVKRMKEEGLFALKKEIGKRKIGLTLRQTLKYG